VAETLIRKRAAAKEPAHDARAAVAQHHESGGSDELYGIGDLCNEFGITARAVRFYEDAGEIIRKIHQRLERSGDPLAGGAAVAGR